MEMPDLTEESPNRQGSFYLDFPKDDKFSSPSVITDYLNASMKKISSEGDFLIMYEISDFNLKNLDKSFRMTIHSDKQMFHQFNDKNAVKSAWTPAPLNAIYHDVRD